MAGSLLAYLFPRIKGSQEDVATLALTYLLQQSNILRSAFTALAAKQLHIDACDLRYNTQVAGQQLERPDIVGTDKSGKERILCEAKFFAALTSNQPKTYLDRMNHSGGLIFFCPQSRIVGLWQQLLALVTSRKIDDFCVDVNGVHMAIISWTDVLDALLFSANRSAPEMKDDLLQLIGFCNEIENTSFIPFKSEDLGSDIAKSIDRYYMVIDSVAQILMNHKEYPASKKGLRATPLWNGYAQYLKIRQIPIGVVFYRELWKKATSIETPFWVSLHNEKWQQDDSVYRYYATLPAQMVERNHDGITYIALKTPVGLTLEETAKELANQILYQVNAFHQFIT